MPLVAAPQAAPLVSAFPKHTPCDCITQACLCDFIPQPRTLRLHVGKAEHGDGQCGHWDEGLARLHGIRVGSSWALVQSTEEAN